MTIRMLSLVGACALLAAFNISCNKTGKGAAIGGASGAALGTAIGVAIGHGRGHTGRGAGIGAAVGAAVGTTAGAIIGHYMDKNEKELREKVKNAEITREGNELRVKFASGILFDTGESSLRGQSKTNLKEFADVLKEYPQTELSIEGHTDSRGSNKRNKKLSEARAKSVLKYLDEQGVAPGRMFPFGYGEERPINSKSTPEALQENRRVEIKIVPNEALTKEAQALEQIQS